MEQRDPQAQLTSGSNYGALKVICNSLRKSVLIIELCAESSHLHCFFSLMDIYFFNLNVSINEANTRLLLPDGFNYRRKHSV